MIEKNSLADINNRYEIISAATESGINQEDPNWKILTDREKWSTISSTNHGAFMKKQASDFTIPTQEEIISKVLKARENKK